MEENLSKLGLSLVFLSFYWLLQKITQRKCPCQSDCPQGCPCPSYACPDTQSNILILNTRYENVPIITDIYGSEKRDFDFEFQPDTEVDMSCSITWQNELFVFGGARMKRQISKLVGCSLTNVGQLSFDHKYGACSNVANRMLYLCFNSDYGDEKKCRFASSPNDEFEEISDSSYEHEFTRIGSSDRKLTLSFFVVQI